MGPTKAEGEKGHRQYETGHLGACAIGGTEFGQLEHGAAILPFGAYTASDQSAQIANNQGVELC
jgi:hypothetical protein